MEFPVSLTSLLTVLACTTMWCKALPYHRHNSAPAPIGHDGRVVDTPEVAQAKAAHLAAFSKLAFLPTAHYHGAPDHRYAAAAAAAPAVYGPNEAYSNPGYFSSRIQHGQYGYRGPPAPLAHDGRVVDTPEVAQAKAAHFAAFNHAASHAYTAPAPGSYQSEDYGDTGAYHSDDDGSGEGQYEGHASAPYQGPPAPLAQDGRVVDTPEVAQAKAAHLAAFHRASHGHQAPHPAAGGYYSDY